MSYAIVEVEVTAPLPRLALAEGSTGLAILLRRKGKAIDFWMEALSQGENLEPEALAARIADRARAKLLSESLREELALEADTDTSAFPSLTLAVCTKDRPDTLRRLLQSLDSLGLTRPSPEVEVLVVDNAPSDTRTRELAASFGVRYACEPKPGLDFARNKALEEARGELIAYLDDDVVVDRDWLLGLKEAWAENPDAGAFTGLVLPYELVTRAQILFEERGGFRRGFEKKRYAGPSLPGNRLYPCNAGIFGAGANMAFRREALLAIGGFDEALDTGRTLPGGGDLDIFYRIIRAGYPLIYEPRMMVFHQHRQDIAGLRRQYWSWGLGFMAFLAKTYETDPEARAKLRWLIPWWFQYLLRALGSSLLGRYNFPPDMLAAELWGSVMGFFGEYGRSKRRIEAIRRQYS